ncbi:50S ribosomal protein L15 [Candidatus Dojkabacteria bacterium]|uniref:Large ribosomal subunit protein uL15 n=2 Tax=Candidatus Dojkabacteria TaxID=74243 RepID=A0A136KKZ4_9BACT|nr:MAG: 50S ribosomal protein L15 [candidate division WS6 bacterium OLB21]MBW7953601.1 50S ribosomal protein L15 [Candidatus Dojkabacteria bacterium]
MLKNLSKHSQKKSKRVGRGYGSGKGGHTSSRGQKGQKSRAGYKPARKAFEGGSMPLSRRLPKFRGFRRGYFKSRFNQIILSLSDLDVFKSGETVSFETLTSKNMIPAKSKNNTIKILGNGKLNKKLNISGIELSESAKGKILAEGGSVE